MKTRTNLRNIAIVAHVDHGKTTLVDALLSQAGALGRRSNQERIMDSGDIEREKGITILAKNTSVFYEGEHAPDGGVTINVIDTPGHADFSGEVERGLTMADGVLLLVDAAEGPLPQTRFVLSKALAAGLPVITVINKTDRSDARIAEVLSQTQDLLVDLALDAGVEDIDAIADTPVIYACARDGRADTVAPADGTMPANPTIEPLFQAILEHVPAPSYDEDAPLAALVTNLDASPFLGRLALVRIYSGVLRKGATVGWAHADGVSQARISELLVTHGLERVSEKEAFPGDIVAIAGIEDVTIGDSLVDLADPRPLPRIHVDEPAIAMTIGVNSSPMAGRGKNHKVTARQVKDRLDQEQIGNVSIRVYPTDRPDVWEIHDRGELALAVLVETMRREGFELTVGKPRVVTKHIDGVLHEPYEHATVDVPEEHVGTVTQLFATRKGQMTTMTNHGTGWVRMEFIIPARGLIGFRSIFLTATRGTGILATLSAGYQPWAGDIPSRATGSLVADRAGAVTAYALARLEDRGTFFVTPGTEVYEGQVVGESPRPGDMEVNVVRQKELTNMRSSTADVFETLQAPRTLTLEESIEFAADDECVEVTPEDVRIRKTILDSVERYKAANRRKGAKW